MARRIADFRVYTSRKEGGPESLAYDEEEFNDGTVTIEDAIKELVEDSNYTQLTIHIEFE